MFYSPVEFIAFSIVFLNPVPFFSVLKKILIRHSWLKMAKTRAYLWFVSKALLFTFLRVLQFKTLQKCAHYNMNLISDQKVSFSLFIFMLSGKTLAILKLISFFSKYFGNCLLSFIVFLMIFLLLTKIDCKPKVMSYV